MKIIKLIIISILITATSFCSNPVEPLKFSEMEINYTIWGEGVISKQLNVFSDGATVAIRFEETVKEAMLTDQEMLDLSNQFGNFPKYGRVYQNPSVRGGVNFQVVLTYEGSADTVMVVEPGTVKFPSSLKLIWDTLEEIFSRIFNTY